MKDLVTIVIPCKNEESYITYNKGKFRLKTWKDLHSTSKKQISKLDKQSIDPVGAAYKNYLIEDVKILPNMSKERMTELGYRLTQEEFINKIKTVDDFAIKWDIIIETKELSEKERISLLHAKHGNKGHHIEAGFNMLDEFEIPTKLIKITYNGQIQKSYE